MGLGIVRLQFQCPAAAGDRFVQLPLVLQHGAQVVVGLGIVGLQFQGPAAAGNRFGKPVQGTIRSSQVVVEGGRGPVQPDRPLDALDGGLVLARLRSNHAEKMERIGMIRLDRENLPIDLLGSLQPTALMVLDRNRQCFGSRCHETKNFQRAS